MVARKELLTLAVLLITVSGCCRRCQEERVKKDPKKISKKAAKEAKMPRAGKELAFNDLFLNDSELDELIERAGYDHTATADSEVEVEAPESNTEELAWLDDYALDEDDDLGWESTTDMNEKSLKTVYFGFNKYGIAGEQSDNLKYNAEEITEAIEEADARGEELKVVVEGHACHSAGDPIYNLALSQKRAGFIADKLKENGVPADRLQIVGRGEESPAVVDGKSVSGTREQQWLNRRSEFYLISA